MFLSIPGAAAQLETESEVLPCREGALRHVRWQLQTGLRIVIPLTFKTMK
jgi:hypothetical protein